MSTSPSAVDEIRTRTCQGVATLSRRWSSLAAASEIVRPDSSWLTEPVYHNDATDLPECAYAGPKSQPPSKRAGGVITRSMRAPE